jgi:signal transduction histidine kinase
MSQSLQEKTEALSQLNKDLEGMVKKRTEEIEEKSEQVQQAYQELKDTQVQLVQSEKMASLGQLVAGIAHEIKNPLNFIYGNTDFLREYIDNLQRLIELYEGQSQKDSKINSKVESFKQEVNYDFMLEDLQTLIKNFEEGANRIHDIISDLKSFSRTDSEQFQLADIHETLDLALNILHNEYRDQISIHKEYGQMPHLECHPGKMTQVFINLLNNACQAIAEQGDIWIRTSKDGDFVVVEIEDNGPGIEGKQVGKIFEPFFTTKPVGKGTGLGLSISYGIIQQHGGTITVESDEGKGAKFCVKLPLDHLEKNTS